MATMPTDIQRNRTGNFTEAQHEQYWEKKYNLPAGVLEAVRHNPTPARIAEIIATVRDEAVKNV